MSSLFTFPCKYEIEFRLPSSSVMDDWTDPGEDIPEDYQAGEDDSDFSDEEDGVEFVEQFEGKVGDRQLGISVEQARANLEAAGSEVDEDPEKITVNGNLDLMSKDVDELLDEIVEDLEMKYKPVDFQRVAVNALGESKNVILVRKGFNEENDPS